MKELKTVQPGEKFNYGGLDWEVLEQTEGRALCLAVRSIGDKAFDTNNKNDWKGSSLRKYLNGTFLKKLVKAGAKAGAFLPMELDLTSDDGLDDYGSSTDKIGLLSCDQYRKFRKLIPQVKGWWWTITPWSTESGGNASGVRVVYSGGSRSSSNAYNGNYGVRPLCTLDSSILISHYEGEDQEEADGAFPFTFKIRADASELDIAIEKADRLKSLLKEANELIGSLKSTT
jgi:hypothetical protein